MGKSKYKSSYDRATKKMRRKKIERKQDWNYVRRRKKRLKLRPLTKEKIEITSVDEKLLTKEKRKLP